MRTLDAGSSRLLPTLAVAGAGLLGESPEAIVGQEATFGASAQIVGNRG